MKWGQKRKNYLGEFRFRFVFDFQHIFFCLFFFCIYLSNIFHQFFIYKNAITVIEEMYIRCIFLYAYDYREKPILQAWKRFIGQFAAAAAVFVVDTAAAAAATYSLYFFYYFERQQTD